jgi:hypothetical protein
MAAGRPLPIEPEKEMIIMAIHDHSLELAGKQLPVRSAPSAAATVKRTRCFRFIASLPGGARHYRRSRASAGLHDQIKAATRESIKIERF